MRSPGRGRSIGHFDVSMLTLYSRRESITPDRRCECDSESAAGRKLLPTGAVNMWIPELVSEVGVGFARERRALEQIRCRPAHDFGQVCPSPSQVCPRLPAIRPGLPEAARNSAVFGPGLPEAARRLTWSARVCPPFGHTRAGPARVCPPIGQVCPRLPATQQGLPETARYTRPSLPETA
jgi:hypothetical protein